jgi:hypothetical protein
MLENFGTMSIAIIYDVKKDWGVTISWMCCSITFCNTVGFARWWE